MSGADIIVAGHLCLDMHPEMDAVTLAALGAPGRLYEIGGLTLSTGGAVSNTGLALHRLGVKVRLMATTGDDLVGRATLDVIRVYDPALSEYIKVVSGQPSSYTIVLTPQRVDRIFLHCTGPNRSFGVEDVDFTALETASIFHLGYPSLLPRLFAREGDELVAVMGRAKAAGIVTSMDMALPDPKTPAGQADWQRIFQRVLPYTDIFVPSIEESLFCLRRADYDAWGGQVFEHVTAAYLAELADELLDMGAVVAGFKLGEMGLYLKTGGAAAFERLARLNLDVSGWAGQTVYAPAFQVEVAGTTGAGDSAYAGLLAALLRGLPPAEAARMACAVGACNVEAMDATSGVRSWDETAARLAAGWPSRNVQLRQS